MKAIRHLWRPVFALFITLLITGQPGARAWHPAGIYACDGCPDAQREPLGGGERVTGGADKIEPSHAEVLSSLGIKFPFQAGSGLIKSRHEDYGSTDWDAFAYDMCEGDGPWSTIGDYVLAPVDMEYVDSWTGKSNPSVPHLDYHIFKIVDESHGTLCLSLGHFDLVFGKAHGYAPGWRIPQGAALGQVGQYWWKNPDGTKSSIPHLHMGLWWVNRGAPCTIDPRIPFAFVGDYGIDGREEYSTGDAVTSTNNGMCAGPLYGSISSPADSDLVAQNTSASGDLRCFPDDPAPPASCANPTAPGVYFYGNPNYENPCWYTTGDVPHFGDTPIGNNDLESVRIVGAYKVRIYEDAGFAGASEPIETSKPDIGASFPSLDGRVTSATVSAVSDPVPSTNCLPADRDGVYFYSDTDYRGDCIYSTTDIAHFGNTPVGNNDLESVRIVGSYRARIYEDAEYKGASEPIETSKADVGAAFPSLDGRVTSATVSAVTGPPAPGSCTPDTREGVYFYSDTNYKGNCVYSVVSIPHFGDTAVGNNNLESVRLVGPWRARIYEDADYSGPSEPVDTSKPDIGASFPSLDGRITSATVRPVATPTPTPAPQVSDCPTDNRDGVYFYSGANYSGSCHYSAANVTRFADTPIGNNNLASIAVVGRWQVTIHEDEDYLGAAAALQTSVASVAAAFPLLAGSVSSAGVEHRPDIVLTSDLTLTTMNPLAAESVTARFSIQNVGSQAVTITRLGVGSRGPGCSIWDDEPAVDFPWRFFVTIQPGETYSYREERAFHQTGTGYFAQAMFQTADGNWVHTGSRIGFAVAPGLQVVRGLTLTPDNPYVGQTVTARYTVKNVGPRTLSLDALSTTARGPDCVDLSCPQDVGFAAQENINLQPGQEHTYEGQRTFLGSGAGYFAQPIFRGPNGWWHAISQGTLVPFAVEQGIEMITPLTLTLTASTDSTPLAGEAVTARFSIRNAGSQPITLARLGVGAHGPNCATWDDQPSVNFPFREAVTLQPGQTYAYEGQRAFFQEGGGYFAQATYQLNDDTWVRAGTRIDWTVAAGLQVVQGLTLNPATPYAGQLVTARYTVKNLGPRALSIGSLSVTARGPNCADLTCPRDVGYGGMDNIVLQPNGQFTYENQRAFSEPGSGYFAQPIFRGPNDWWLLISHGDPVSFVVTAQPQACPTYSAQPDGSIEVKRSAGAGPACAILEFQASGTFSITSGWVFTSPLTLDGLVLPTAMIPGEQAPQVLPYSRPIVASAATPLQLHFAATDLPSGSELGFWYHFTPAVQPPPCGTGIIPTYLSSDFFGQASTLDGQPIPAATCILAFDPDGVLCGRILVEVPGQWGNLHVYGDDPTTDPDEGAQSGDTIRFTVAGYPAQTSVTPLWSDRQRTQVELYASAQQYLSIPLRLGWNLFSFNLAPLRSGQPLVTPADVLAGIAGHYTALLGYDLGAHSFYPDLPDHLNDLRSLTYELGYWIRMTRPQTLTLQGATVAPNHPLPLDAGWNLISYLPTTRISVQSALQSLGSNLLAVLAFHDGAAHSYYPDLPPYMSDLQCLRPQHGYWVKLAHAAVLTYPHTGTCAAATAGAQTDMVTPTRLWCEVYSLHSQCAASPVPPGTVVRAYDPQGVLCGEEIVQVAGEWGTMHVYGDDPDTGVDEGAQNSDALRFTLNGAPATPAAPVLWEDRALRQVALSAAACNRTLFLPVLRR